jgi:hypothetical protein
MKLTLNMYGRLGRCIPWVLLVALALAVRLVGITTTSVWHDEATSLQAARLGLYDLVVRLSLADHQPPLMYLLIKLWAVVSWSPTWLRLLPVALSVGGVVLAVLWIRRWDTRAGWLAGLLAATSPVMVHYAQELRAYALLYTCLLGGLYCGELLARRYTRGAAMGLLLCAVLMSYAHYVGLLAAGGLWIYATARGADRRRSAVLAGLWVALISPVLVAGLLHASHRSAAGFWVVPLTVERGAELIGSWIGLSGARFGQHASIWRWEEAGGSVAYSWVALGLRVVVTVGVSSALIVALTAPDRRLRSAAGVTFAAGAFYFILIAVVSWAAVPIALARTTFPAFVPLIGVMALSGARRGKKWAATAGIACCTSVAAVWIFLSVMLASSELDRRPAERHVFGAIAERLGPADLVIVFSPEMQASAGYFLRDRARADQIHCTEYSRLADGPDGVRLRPIPRRPNPEWFVGFRRAAIEVRAEHPLEHAVWLMDLGPRSVGDQDRRRVLEWLEERYVAVERVDVGQRWPLAARRFVPMEPIPPGDTNVAAPVPRIGV